MALSCDRFQKVDDATRSLHYYLDSGDTCYFIGEFTSHQGYAYSELNQIISNLKKSPLLKKTSPAEYKHKLKDIRRVAACFRRGLTEEVLNTKATLVPIPPSKTKSNSEYDNRITMICHGIVLGYSSPDVQELICCHEDTIATHNQASKPSPEALVSNYRIAVDPGYNPRPILFLVDDMLTTGSHFKACKMLISKTYPDSEVIGLFVARRVFADPHESELFR